MIAAPLSWCVVAASSAGTAHLAQGQVSQDGYAWRVVPSLDDDREGVLVIGVADGAGSAAQSGAGVAAALPGFVDAVAQTVAHTVLHDVTDDDTKGWIDAAHLRLVALSAESGQPLDDFACTLLGAVVGTRHAIFLRIGDGVIASKAHGSCKWQTPIPSQRGQYRNETFFLTQKPVVPLVAHFRGTIGCLAVSTDGLDLLCVTQATGEPYAPFFDHLFAAVGSRMSDTRNTAMADALERYLASDAVNQHTDDDKTLVLALRTAAA